jgi:hypothetical protein
MTINISSTIQQLAFISMALYTIYFSFKNKNSLDHYFYFGILALLGIIEGLDSQIIRPLFNRKIPFNIEIFNIYLLFEFSILSFFFYNETSSNIFKSIIKSTSIIIILITSISFIYDTEFIRKNYQILTLIEALIMISFSIKIFVEVIFDDNINDILQSPKFITSFGIFFLFSITIPYFLLTNYLRIFNAILYNKLDYLSNVAYIFFYTTIIRSFALKKSDTTHLKVS